VFVEWMMGLAEGRVTGVPGLTRAQMLKALGNGVMPQQGTVALRGLRDRVRAALLAQAA
jgi:DNA (cytosine-5)-methyltransferase 1